MTRRVVVTGLGALTPLGIDVDSTWTALNEGRSGIRRISRWDPSEMPTQIAGELPDYWDITELMDPKEARRADRYTQYALWAANEAILDSGLLNTSIDPEKAGIILGTGVGGISSFEQQHKIFLERGVRRVSPFFITMMIADIAAGMLSIKYGFKGINFTTTSACASAGHAIASSLDAIRLGRADIIITGGSEAPIIPISIAGFCQNRAMTVQNDAPQKASRPFDAARDGFVMSEGSGIIVLEELEHAKARGAKIYAEIAGAGTSADAFHITAPPENGEGAFSAMKKSLEDSSTSIDEIGYINAHGTSTPVGDGAECKAIKKLFPNNTPLVSSTKGALGHLLGAAAGIEAIIAIKSMNERTVLPTMNMENVSEDCIGVNHVTEIVKTDLKAVMSNSFGFGGHNTSLLFKKL